MSQPPYPPRIFETDCDLYKTFAFDDSQGVVLITLDTRNDTGSDRFKSAMSDVTVSRRRSFTPDLLHELGLGL